MTTSSSPDRKLDTTACDREPIHIPGGIQPHGYLVNVSQDGFRVRQASENVTALFGRPLDDILGRALDDLVGTAAVEVIARSLLNATQMPQPVYAGAVALGEAGYFDVIVHRSGKATLIEFEPVQRSGAADFRLLYAVMGRFLKTLSHVDSVDAVCEYAVRSIRELTGMGRVFLYSFDHNEDALVMAESVEPGYPSYSGQRFPASDIPHQARRLYVANHVRLIADANYTPARLVPAARPGNRRAERPRLRRPAQRVAGAPAVHAQHGHAGVDVGLADRQGPALGHDLVPRQEPAFRSPFEMRTACEQLGQILALRIESSNEDNEYAFRLRLRGRLVSILAALSQPEEFVDNMASASQDLLMLMDARGRRAGVRGRHHPVRRHAAARRGRRAGRMAGRAAMTNCSTPIACRATTRRPRPSRNAPAACWRCRSRASTGIT